MKLSGKGWLQKYLNYRLECPLSREFHSTQARQLDEPIEHYLYRILQPTGFMYGYPADIPFVGHHELSVWSSDQKMTVLLVESLILCSLYDYPPDVRHQLVVSEEIMLEAGSFYAEIFPELADRTKLISRKKRTDLELSEYLIESNVGVKNKWSSVMKSFFHNSLLFLDVIYFLSWVQRKGEIAGLKQHIVDIHKIILRILAAAAQADDVIKREETHLFNFILSSAQLTLEHEADIMDVYLNKRIGWEQIDLSPLDNWLAKKYVLEMAILMTWADRDLVSSEMEFLQQLTFRLNLPESELDQSLFAVESFVSANWESVHYLQDKAEYQIATQRLKKRFTNVLLKNRNRILMEVRESKELMTLLAKSRKEELTEEERKIVKAQLLDILKTIPALAIFLLPFGSILLPLALQILPQHIIKPSAFYD